MTAVEMTDQHLGALRARLDAALAEHGGGLVDLTVLSTDNDPFRVDTTTGHVLGAWLKAQIDRLVPHGTAHLRGLHYKLVGSAWKPDGTAYVNGEADWHWLAKAAKAARWLGYVPFHRIRDERNSAAEIFVADEKSRPSFGGLISGCGIEVPALTSLLPTAGCGRPIARQPYRIILFGEKSSIAGELLPIASRVGGELILPTGEASDTLIAEMAARAAADVDGRPAVIFYFADFDPSGWQMPISVARKVQALRDLLHPDLRLEVHRVALTLEQVRAFDLPSTPLKATERRAGPWLATMGRQQTEIDALMALHPGALRRIAWDAIAPFFDATLEQRAHDLAEACRVEARRRLLEHPEYHRARDAIESALSGVTTAIAALRAAQAEAMERLSSIPDTIIPPPEPVIESTAPAPLFSTSDDYVTASRKLIAAKRLDGDVG